MKALTLLKGGNKNTLVDPYSIFLITFSPISIPNFFRFPPHYFFNDFSHFPVYFMVLSTVFSCFFLLPESFLFPLNIKKAEKHCWNIHLILKSLPAGQV